MVKDEVRILGAGLSGLTAAINLAKAGKAVRVFEKRKAVGEQILPKKRGHLIRKIHGLKLWDVVLCNQDNTTIKKI